MHYSLYSSKVLESIINNRLTFKNDMMAHSDPYQAGFKKESRTNDNIFTLYSAIQIQKSIKKPLYTCFVDFTKAFDYVNRSALYHKLIESKVNSKLLRVLISMFNKAQSAVRWDGVVGDNITSKSGVLQGGIVSPNLFNHYLYDIGNYLEKKDGILVGSNPVNYLLYADDLILMSTTASGLQNHINNLYKFCAAWHLIVSLPKTKVLIFNDSHKAEKYIFNFGKETIDIVSEYKYLGIIFTSNSRNVFEQTVIERQQKATAAMYQMCSDIKNSIGQPPIKLALKTFNAQVLSVLEYGIEIWGNLKQTQCRDIEKFHLKYLKNVLGVRRQTSTAGVHMLRKGRSLFKQNTNMLQSDTGTMSQNYPRPT